jgi:hypothetical protein
LLVDLVNLVLAVRWLKTQRLHFLDAPEVFGNSRYFSIVADWNRFVKYRFYLEKSLFGKLLDGENWFINWPAAT